ncbi:hypothetical protein L7F22_018352 [Adiantum nelumboides]|nr:hypothetical protein [Adiantum nelumboides]
MSQCFLETIMHVALRARTLFNWFWRMDRKLRRIEGKSTIQLVLENGQELMLHDVRFVPGIKKSLLSIGQLDTSGYPITFGGGIRKMLKGSMQAAKGNEKGTLYYLHSKVLPGKCLAVADVYSYMKLWQKRLGHMSHKGLQVLSSLGKVDVKKTHL